MSNRKTGSMFEQHFCQILADNGFWAHNLAQNSIGQPFDVIAVKDEKAYAVDCKVCENDTFDLRRIEENQRCAMYLWEDCGNGYGWFALKLSDDRIYMFTIETLTRFSAVKNRLNKKIIESRGVLLEDWMMSCGQK